MKMHQSTILDIQKASNNATWVHCPLRKTEKILEVWYVQHENHLFGWTAFMVSEVCENLKLYVDNYRLELV
jgi:hypothetical protein